MYPLRDRSNIVRSIFRSTLISVVLCSIKQRALGLVNSNANDSVPKSCPSQEVSTSSESRVDVWDNVIDVDSLVPSLDEESRRIGLGHKVFSRSSDNKTGTYKRNLIEQTLDSILAELGDDARYVEYWTRREWRSIHAHADVDEYRAKQEQQSRQTKESGFRYPRNGHVLYLYVGNQVRGPTCIFPNRRSGGDLLRKVQVQSIDGAGDNHSCNTDIHEHADPINKNDSDEMMSMYTDENHVELVTVPAVQGRLLRFQGDYLHAVPRPTDFWLLKFVKGSPQFEPEEEWGRSVVLFNTWNGEPPMGLPIDEESEKSDTNPGESTVSYTCNKKEQWRQVTLSSQIESTREEEQRVSAKIWLLGDYRRRDYKMQTIKLDASESLREALYQESSVMRTTLEIPQ